MCMEMFPSAQVREIPQECTLHKIKENPNDYNKQEYDNIDKKRTKLLKRIPLHRLMDLKVDYAFKQLFGNEKNKDITVVFLNAILQKTGRNRIKDISFSNTELGGEYLDDKQSRLDLLVVTEAKEWINVEIQFANKYDMIKRSIYYWSGVYRQPFQRRMIYKELRPVIAINILNFNLFDQTERFHTSYHLYEDEEGFKLTDIMEIHFIEMPKLIQAWKVEKLDPWNHALARWLLMLGMVDHRNEKVYDDIYRELEEIAMKDEQLRDAFQNWEELSMTPEEYFAYETRLKRVMDEESFQYEMEQLKREIEQGQKEIERGQKEIEQGKKEIEQGQKVIEREKKEVTQGQKEIAQKNKELMQMNKDVEQKKKEVEQKLNEANQRERKAEKEAKEMIAKRLLKIEDMTVEKVAESTNLTLDRVRELKREV